MTHLALLHDQLANHLGEIAAARRRMLDDCNPEALHDLRVALRALRVVLPLLGKQLDPLRQEWQKQARATGPCRDLEVLLTLIATLPEIPASIQVDLFQQEHQSRVALLKQLAAPDLPLLIQRSRIELKLALHQLTADQLRRRINKRARRLDCTIQQQISALDMNASAQTWHLLRLEVKRLRYLIEHCGNWLPNTWQEKYSSLKRSQIALGELHDMDLLISLTACPLDQARQIRLDSAFESVQALNRMHG